MNRYYQLATYFRHRFGCRVQKIPLDAGFSCPNRDGTLSFGGCVFCNPLGSGSGMGKNSTALSEQWAIWRSRYQHTRDAGIFIAYLQSFSNTYGPVEKLTETLNTIERLPGVSGLSVGTRPDCVDQEKLDRIADFAQRLAPSSPAGQSEVWVEFGLQSARDETLLRINRGHDFASFARATHMAAERGIKVCAHIIAGLPGETLDDFLYTVDSVNRLPIHGIKFHSMYVLEHTALAAMWRRGEYVPLTESEYVSAMVHALPRLRSEIIIHRITGDPTEEELLAPRWSTGKRSVMVGIANGLEMAQTWQGRELSAAQPVDSLPPLWFSPRPSLPGALRPRWDTEYTAVAEALGYPPHIFTPNHITEHQP